MRDCSKCPYAELMRLETHGVTTLISTPQVCVMLSTY